MILVLCFCLRGISQGQEKRLVRPEDIIDIRGAADVQVSPDGGRLVFVVTEPADPKKREQPRD